MSIHEEYMRRIYEPYEYLRSTGVSYFDLKVGEPIILFETYEGAVKYFDEYTYHTEPNGKVLSGLPLLPQKKGVRYVYVQNSGRYTAVSYNQQLQHHTVYVNFHQYPQNHPIYHSYVGWAYLQRQSEIDNSNFPLCL